MSGLSWRERMRRMNERSLFGGSGGAARPQGSAAQDVSASARAARNEAVHRLQVGFFGIGAMVLLVGLASIIGGQADRNDKLAVPEAAPTTEPSVAPAQANPLADAGVVPDIAAEPSPSPGLAPRDLPPPPPGRPSPGNAAPGQ
jgi:hypothetical protein